MGPGIILETATGVLWWTGWAVFSRVPHCREGRAGDMAARLSIVIPARNEAENLPRLLSSIKNSGTPPLEILVVDDDSSDATADVAREHGARVLASDPLPEGWRGKTWACHQGARAAKGDLLLFLDADTFFAPVGLKKMAAEYGAVGGALSVLPYHEVQRPYEALSVYFNIVMAAGVGAFTWRGTRRAPAALFGQALMVSREAYEQAGGHEAVRGKILENFHLAQRFREHGIPAHAYGGRGALCFRMYPGGLRDLVEGWSKAFADGASHTPGGLMALISLWLTGGIFATALPLYGWAAGATGELQIALIFYAAYAIQLFAMSRKLGRFPWWSAAAFPFFLLFYFAVFARSIWLNRYRHEVQWKGRTVPVEEDEK